MNMYSKDMVSVVIPCWGEYRKFLGDSLGSVYMQSYFPIETCVVSDKSNVVDAMTAGFERTFGDYIIFLGADDMLMYDYVSECVKYMVDDKVGMVFTGCVPFGFYSNLHSDEVNYNLMYPRGVGWRYSVFGNVGGQQGASLIRRKAFVDIGGFDRSLKAGEDRDILIRMVLSGWKVVCIRKPMMYYRFHSLSQVHDKNDALKCLSKKYPLLYPYRYVEYFFNNPVVAVKRLFKRFK